MGRSRGDGQKAPGGRRGHVSKAAAVVAVALIAVAVFAGATQRAAIAPKNAASPEKVVTPIASGARAAGVQVAWAKVSSIPVYPQPEGSPEQSLSNPNPLGAPLVMLVHATRGGWTEIYLPERPNESLGWVPSADVTLVSDEEHIVVNLDQRLVELFRGQKLVFESKVAVGSPASPTPTGYFYVTEVLKLTDPDSAYGPYALGLSGFSGTYRSFDGGPGQIAIHGTDEPSSIGGYASHGCVRLSNPQISALATQVQAGTPVSVVD